MHKHENVKEILFLSNTFFAIFTGKTQQCTTAHFSKGQQEERNRLVTQSMLKGTQRRKVYSTQCPRGYRCIESQTDRPESRACLGDGDWLSWRRIYCCYGNSREQ